jgi:GT2 family glycosyltransferase
MNASASISEQLSVSLVLFHSDLPRLQATLESLVRAAAVAIEQAAVSAVTVHLIDNSTDPDYSATVRDALAAVHLPTGVDVQLAVQPDNLGFGAGHNRFPVADVGVFHLILNPDVDLDDQVLVLGVQTLRDEPHTVLVCPAVTSANGEREYLCKRYPSVAVLALRAFAPAWLQRRCESRLHAYEMRAECDAQQRMTVPLASGAFMLMRGDSWRAVGGFDERYFLYFEDFDLSLRLAEQGDLVYWPQMKMVHHGGYTASKGWRHIALFVRSGVSFFQRHGWRWI